MEVTMSHRNFFILLFLALAVIVLFGAGGQAARIATGEYPDAVWTGAAFAVVYAADGGLRITDYKH